MSFEQLIDQLSQLGAASWRPMATRRSAIEPRSGKVTRLERIAGEAAKQCGRAWAMRVMEGDRFDVLVQGEFGKQAMAIYEK